MAENTTTDLGMPPGDGDLLAMNAHQTKALVWRKWLLLLAFTALAWHSPAARAQDALKDRVVQLLEKLGSADESQAKAAEESLFKLGSKILPILPEPAGKQESAGRDTRLKKIRAALEVSTKTSPVASKVTIQGSAIRLTDALKALQQQSGNTIVDLREQNGQETGNPTLNLDLKDAPFFVALDDIAKKAGLALNFYTAENAIGLLSAAQAPNSGAGQAGSGASQPGGMFVSYPEAYRISLNRIGLTRDFNNTTGPQMANVQMELAWEPRLRPIMIKLRADQIEATDDKGRKIAASTTAESMELAIRPENPIVDLNLNLVAPPRDAARIAKMQVVADLTVPLAKTTLAISKITDQGKETTSADASLRLMAFEAEPPVWKVTVELKLPTPKGSEKLDSYRQANLTPQVALVKPDSARVGLNGGFSTTQGSTPNSVIYEFLFVDIPGKPDDHGLVVEFPGELKTIPVKWIFQDIPLP